MRTSRRTFLHTVGAAGAAILGAELGAPPRTYGQRRTLVTIAFPETITSMDPHPAPRNSPRESMYEAVFDRFLQQDRQLKYGGHIVAAWQWTDGKMGMDLKIRPGVKFHDGSDLTAEDVAYSIERLRQVSIYKATYGKVKEAHVVDKTSLHLVFERFDPSFPRWLGFLAGFVVPKAYFLSLGTTDEARSEEFSKKPIGSGPYRVVSFTPGSILVLEAFDRYWKGAPPIRRAVMKMVTDPTARVAELLSGQSDITAEVPVEEFGRLSASAGLRGVRNPIADIAELFVSPRFEPFKKEEVRLAVHHAIDKKTLVEKVLLGFGQPVSTTEGPLYDAHDSGFTFPHDPARARQLLQKAGYSPSSPLKLTVMTTKGVRAKDFEVVTAIAQMWKDVGIEAELEVITIPQWFQYRSNRTGQGKGIAPLSLYFWSNATGDPINSVGFQLTSKGPFRVWESEDLVPIIDPIFDERDEAKRIAAAKRAARYAVEKGYIVPLYQVVQPVVMKKELAYQPFPTGVLVPQDMSWA
jgi:peptide/nickel transport system substrate-binding protein